MELGYEENVKLVMFQSKQEKRLQCFSHVKRRKESYVRRSVMEIEVQGRRARGKLNLIWIDCVREDLRQKQLSKENIYDYAWRRAGKNNDSIETRKKISRRRNYGGVRINKGIIEVFGLWEAVEDSACKSPNSG